MKKLKYSIRSISGGMASSAFMPAADQFEASSGIDPDLPVGDRYLPSGLMVPAAFSKFSGANVNALPLAILTDPKNTKVYAVLSNGKLVSYTYALGTETLAAQAHGNCASGAEYYNNYIYIFGSSNKITYNTQTANFTVGQTVTGGSSAATGKITADSDSGTSGTLTLTEITGHFTVGETITDPFGGSAKIVAFPKGTDVSRYGPLNGTPSLVNTWWTSPVAGLGLTELTETSYPALMRSSDLLPNHWGFVHNDSLFFLDFKDGYGLVHRIKTIKGTYEGDSDDTVVPSAYGVLELPYGYYPTSGASHSSSVVLSAVSTVEIALNQGKSALFVWDPDNSDSWDQKIDLFDPLATALIVKGGVVYVISGFREIGVRVSAYAGGDVLRQVAYRPDAVPSMPGAIGSSGGRILFGSYCMRPWESAEVFAVGSDAYKNSSSLHGIMSVGTNVSGNSQQVSCLKEISNPENSSRIVVGAYDDTNGYALYRRGATVQAKMMMSEVVVGRKFKIDEIHVPLCKKMATGATIEPVIHYDSDNDYTALTAISQTTCPDAFKATFLDGEMPTVGQNSFQLSFAFSGTVQVPIAFPIDIFLTAYDD